MKINVRLLLITFIIIVIISLSSTFIFYSTTTSLLKNQYSKTLLNSNTDFSLAFQNLVGSLDSELYEITESKNYSSLQLTNLDFIFSITDQRKIVHETAIFSNNVNRALFTDSFDEFLINYPNVVLKYYQNSEKQAYFYGKIINEEILNNLSEKIRSEVVLIIKKTPFLSSHQLQNEVYFPIVFEAINNNISKQKFNVFYKKLDNGDFFANKYIPEYLIFSNEPIQFLIFNLPTDLAEFRDKIQSIALTIALAGILLSLVFVLLFTTKIRKQISLLNQATRIITKGDLSHRVSIISNDELGNLGKTYNDMLDHIQSNEKSEREYSELITIINKTPLLKNLADTVLEKIIQTTSISFGVFYLVENNNAKPLSTYGISHSVLKSHDSSSFYSDVITNQKTIELTFEDNPPSIKTGLAEIKIKYLIIMPIIFNQTVIGIIELACEHIPEKSPQNYLNKIKDQLAVGLNSSLSYEQLENLVNELRILNEEYHKQNLQISEQNTELLNLHSELKKQAGELEEQRKKAVELSHVKSQFLANMSHELRTPLNSILGLTELIAEDSSTFTKTKDRLKIVLRNGKKLLAMINNILEFSKIESGKFEVNKSNFILSEFLVDIYNAIEPLISEKGLNFEILFDSSYDLLINTDRHKFEQILLNLLSNAIKFTEIGGIKVEFIIIDNISLKVNVVDTGIGISDEDKDRIFNEFEQVDFTSSRKYQGAGLGLAICKKYAELIGGEVSVLSNVVRGATFSISLHNVVLEKYLINKKLLLKNKIANSEQEIRRIAILQDEERGNQEILKYFEKNNYDIIEGIAKLDTLSQLENRSLDGIVFNFNYNLKDDWDLLYHLKQNENTKELPIIVFTEDSSENLFFLGKEFNFITQFDEDNYLKTLFDILIIQYSQLKSVQIISNYKEEIEENINRLGKELSIIENNTDKISNVIINESVNLIIIDAHLFNSKNYVILKKLKIPVLIYLNQSIIKEYLSIIQNNWINLVSDYSKPKEDVYKLINQKITLHKKVKKSISSLIEKTEEINIASKSDKFNVLVVDDDKDAQFTVGEILKTMGCEISFADNGAECLTILNEYKPDLILLDIMMPIMDGFETIKKIRNNEKTQNMNVYAITAQAMLDDINIIKNNGFDDLITKPVNASSLAFKIKKAMEKRAIQI